MFDAPRSQNDVVSPADDVLGPVQRRAGRQLNDIDQVALVLFGDEAGRRLVEFKAGNGDQPDIDHEHDRAGAHKSSRQGPIAEGEPFKAAIEAIKYSVR